MFKNYLIENSLKIKNFKFKINNLVLGKLLIISACLFLVFVTLIIGFQAAAFSGFPKGYDSFNHLSVIRIIRDNFPHVFWNPYWDFGTVLFPRNYPPLYHFLMAGLSGIFEHLRGGVAPAAHLGGETGSIPQLLVWMAALNIIVTALAIFGMIYLLSRKTWAGLSGALFYLSSSTVWSYLLIDGLYSRVFAQMTISLALLSLVFYFKRLKDSSGGPTSLGKIPLRGRTSQGSAIEGGLPLGVNPRGEPLRSPAPPDEGGWPYYLVVFSFAAAFLSHFFATILVTVSFFLLLFWLFPRFDDRFVFTVKIFLPALGLSSFFYFPLLFWGLGRQSLVGSFEGAPYAPLPLSQLFRQTYPGVPFLSVPILLFLSLLVFLTRKQAKLSHPSGEIGSHLKGETGETVEKIFWLSGFLSVAALLYVLGFWGRYFYGIYPQQLLLPAVFFLAIFTGLGLSLLLHLKILNRRFLFIITIGLATLALSQIPHLKTVAKDQSRAWPDIRFKTLDEERLFRFAHRHESLGGAFNFYSSALQTRGYYEVGIVFPDFHFWFEEEVFGQVDNPKETRFFVDWYAIKGLYAERLTDKAGQPLFLGDKLTKNGFEPVSGYEWVLGKASPILEARKETPVVWVKADDWSYRKILTGLAEEGADSQVIIPLKRGKTERISGQIPVVSSWQEMEEVLGPLGVISNEAHLPGGVVRSLSASGGADLEGGKDGGQKVNFIHSQKREIELEDQFQGVLFRESYFRNWHAWLEKSKVKGQKSKVDLKIYQAGPGLMYVFLPKDYATPAKVVFEYRSSLIEKIGVLISFVTFTLILLSWLGVDWKRKVWAGFKVRS